MTMKKIIRSTVIFCFVSVLFVDVKSMDFDSFEDFSRSRQRNEAITDALVNIFDQREITDEYLVSYLYTPEEIADRGGLEACVADFENNEIEDLRKEIGAFEDDSVEGELNEDDLPPLAEERRLIHQPLLNDRPQQLAPVQEQGLGDRFMNFWHGVGSKISGFFGRIADFFRGN